MLQIRLCILKVKRFVDEIIRGLSVDVDYIQKIYPKPFDFEENKALEENKATRIIGWNK